MACVSGPACRTFIHPIHPDTSTAVLAFLGVEGLQHTMVVPAVDSSLSGPFAACLTYGVINVHCLKTWFKTFPSADSKLFSRFVSETKLLLNNNETHGRLLATQVKKKGNDPMLLLLEDVIVGWLHADPLRIPSIRDSQDSLFKLKFIESYADSKIMLICWKERKVFDLDSNGSQCAEAVPILNLVHVNNMLIWVTLV